MKYDLDCKLSWAFSRENDSVRAENVVQHHNRSVVHQVPLRGGTLLPFALIELLIRAVIAQTCRLCCCSYLRNKQR